MCLDIQLFKQTMVQRFSRVQMLNVDSGLGSCDTRHRLLFGTYHHSCAAVRVTAGLAKLQQMSRPPQRPCETILKACMYKSED